LYKVASAVIAAASDLNDLNSVASKLLNERRWVDPIALVCPQVRCGLDTGKCAMSDQSDGNASLPSLIASIVIFFVFMAFQFWLMMHSLH
jgi:hypothetical protein